MFVHMGTDHNLSAKIETHNTWYYHASVQVVMSFLLCPAVSTSFIGWRLAALLREVIRWWGLSSCHQQFHCIGWRRRVTAQRSKLRLTWLVVCFWSSATHYDGQGNSALPLHRCPKNSFTMKRYISSKYVVLHAICPLYYRNTTYLGARIFNAHLKLSCKSSRHQRAEYNSALNVALSPPPLTLAVKGFEALHWLEH